MIMVIVIVRMQDKSSVIEEYVRAAQFLDASPAYPTTQTHAPSATKNSY